MVKNEGNDESVAGSVYEIGYLATPSIVQDKIHEVSEKINDLIKKAGGTVITDEAPKLRELAYPMEKIVAHKKEIFSSAYFGWVKFEIDREKINSLAKEVEREENIIRYLLISTVRENTIASRRPVARQGGEVRRKETKGPKMSDEEIEKTIEQLITQ
ncbi:MAG: 30S ribosomal protein S6 [Patescibacteria group bacterium]